MKNNAYFEKIKDVFYNNFKITRLYAAYLEHFPEIITEDLVKSICEGGVAKEDALAALLCEIFGLDTINSAEDRALLRNYIRKSIVIADAERYTKNPYYRNIKTPNVKVGNWELRGEAYEAYRGVVFGDIIIEEDFTEIPPLCFFEKRFEFPAVLEGGNEWMTLTPVDLDTSEEAIREAHGKVITFGLGLGYYTYMVSEKPEVEKITVVEKSEDVIKLFKTYVLPQFSHSEKVEIICDDAFRFAEFEMPKTEYDVAFVDTWRDASDGAPMYCRMKPLEAKNPKTKFVYWIENFIISRLRAIKFSELNKLYEQGALTLSKEEIKRELTDINSLIKCFDKEN